MNLIEQLDERVVSALISKQKQYEEMAAGPRL